MRFARFVAVLLTLIIMTACGRSPVPQRVAEAMAREDGGVVIKSYEFTPRSRSILGTSVHHILICQDNRLSMKVVSGTASEPKLELGDDTILGVCGEQEKFWDDYEATLQLGYKRREALDTMTELKKIIER